ncbi:unnamed protein product [Euphydryas editha]|uniref:Uncharacterized protein n=1 Tax=Euphydryas editha TaxID=104508 RepID=A0AAU9TTG4_EUPED|nr:unnamed protein product [Euphydryas editha]
MRADAPSGGRSTRTYYYTLTLSLGVGGVPRGELVDDGAHAARVERRQRRLVDARRRALRRPQHAHVLYTLTLSLSHLGLAAFLAASSSMTARTRRASSGGSGGWWMRADAPSGGRSTRTYYILSLSHSLTWAAAGGCAPTRPPAAAARARIIYSHSLTLSLGVGGVPRGELVDDGAHAARVERRQRRLVDARRRALRRPQHAHVLYTLTLSLSHLGLAAFLAASSSMTARTRRASSGGSGGWWMRADAPSGGRSTRTYYILSLSHLGLAAFLAASSSMTARTRRASSGGSGGWWMRADAPSGGRSTRTYYILSLSHSLTWGWRRSSRRARR